MGNSIWNSRISSSQKFPNCLSRVCSPNMAVANLKHRMADEYVIYEFSPQTHLCDFFLLITNLAWRPPILMKYSHKRTKNSIKWAILLNLTPAPPSFGYLMHSIILRFEVISGSFPITFMQMNQKSEQGLFLGTLFSNLWPWPFSDIWCTRTGQRSHPWSVPVTFVPMDKNCSRGIYWNALLESDIK